MDRQVREQIEYALELIRAEREEGVEILYRTMGKVMLFVANGVVHNVHSAEDIVQESLLKVVLNIKHYRRGTNGYAWICRIVRNYVKSSGGRVWQELGEFEGASSCSFEEKTETTVLVEQLMRELSEEMREMVYRKYFLDMTVREIGKEMNRSKSYVSKMILRAEKLMKSRLE